MEVSKDDIKERYGLNEMRELIREFLNSGEGRPEVREYISSAFEDDALLLAYLQGRKYRAEHAWETLKRQAEVRFIEYPEVFQDTPPEFIYPLIKNCVFGILKSRDKYGRAILCYNLAQWNPDEISLQQLVTAGTHFLDIALRETDMMKNGLIFIQNTTGFGMKHVKQHTLPAMLRMWNIFYHAYPLQVKGVYYVNVPNYFHYLSKLIKPFLSKKFKERLNISTPDKGFKVLHENISPSILPKFLGGIHENLEAFDMDLLKIVKIN